MQKIISVKHIGDKNLFHFLEYEGVKVGDKVVFSIEDFETVGTVERVLGEVDKDKASELSSVKRKATESDISKYNELLKKAKNNLKDIKKKSLELGLFMKFVCAEYSLDGSKIMITFSSEDRVDFRQLLKELASMLKTRIELKQIGQRDEVKVCGGVGPCGQPCCCARFLNDFNHVTVKMAKVQGLSLSPTKINGICGRLMCCLGYESDTYEKILENMPKVNSEVLTPNGKGIVVYNDILRERVSVKRQSDGESFVVEDFALEEVSAGGKKFKPLVREEKLQESKESEKNKKPEISEDKPQQNKPFEHKKEERRHDNSRPEKKNHFDNKKQNREEKPTYGIEIIEAENVTPAGASSQSNEQKNNKKNGKFWHYKKNKKFKNNKN